MDILLVLFVQEYDQIPQMLRLYQLIPSHYSLTNPLQLVQINKILGFADDFNHIYNPLLRGLVAVEL